MNKFFSRSGLRSLKRTAKDLIATSQTSNSILAPLYVPIQEVKKFNESLQQNLPNMTDVAYFLNGYNQSQRLSLAGAGGSKFSYPVNDNNSILFCKPLDGSERPGDIKTGTVEQDPTHTTQKPVKQRVLKKRMENVNANAVPASSLARAFEFAGLGLKLASSALGGKIKGTISSDDKAVYNSVVNEKNADLISSTLCRMRGIPLKLGQTLSIQDDNLIPKAFKEALERAQRAADIMPDSQVDQMLKQELGVDWMDRFQEFDRKPIAAASIGQVHKAITKKGEVVAVKVQYPGVAESIDSDLQNLKRLVTYLNLLPKTMYIDNILNHTRTELKEECDYILEAEKQMRMKELLGNRKGYFVPGIIPELTTKRVLTSEWIDGIGIDECQTVLNQEEKDRLGHKIFHLVLTQLFELRYVQTDPNPANFFYNPETDVLSIIDYGAAREYSKDFVSNYLDVIYGAATHNPELVHSASVKMGFLTGEEGKDMKDAHVGAVMIVGEPFAAKGAFDFGSANMTARIYEKIPHMVKNRLRPPPQEVYSLHRILSGAFLACMKLKARVNCGKIFKEVYTNALPNLKS